MTWRMGSMAASDPRAGMIENIRGMGWDAGEASNSWGGEGSWDELRVGFGGSKEWARLIDRIN